MPKFQCYCICLISSLLIVSRSHVIVTKHPSWKLVDEAECGNSNSDRIIGGKNASMGAYPWIARIGYIDGDDETRYKEPELAYRCGGTLVTKMYVVTAAHCLSNLPDKYKVGGVRLGEHNTETDPDCENEYCAKPVQDFRAARIIVHSKYGDPPFKNDIGIIRLDRAAVYNGWVLPICLPSGDLLNKNFVNEKAEVGGWGIYDINEPKSSVILQTIKLPVVATEKCTKAFKVHADIGVEQMCVGGEVGADSCGGDSGGPLMKVEATDSSPKYFIIGVVSFGAKHCGQSAIPAVYSKMSYYIDWVLDNMSP